MKLPDGIKTAEQFINFLLEKGYDYKAGMKKHREESHISANYYAWLKRREFLKSIPDSALYVYLDLNIWIHFRDVCLKKGSENQWLPIYQMAHKLADYHQVYFIASLPLLFEILKQKNDQHRRALISLISKLSKNVGIDYYKNLITSELMDFHYGFILKDGSRRLNNYQFNRASIIMGMPQVEGKVSQYEQTLLNKFFIDLFYTYTFNDMFEFMEYDPTMKESDVMLATQFNERLEIEESFRCSDFEYVLNSEFNGQIEASKSIINNALLSMTQDIAIQHNRNSSEVSLEDIENSPLINMFINLFRLKKLGNYLPSMQVHASLHALIRTSKDRKFNQNHLFDFRHAAEAIPYCDYFITDHALAQALNNKPLNYGKRFNTKILDAKPETVMECFETICELQNSKQITASK